MTDLTDKQKLSYLVKQALTLPTVKRLEALTVHLCKCQNYKCDGTVNVDEYRSATNARNAVYSLLRMRTTFGVAR